MELWKLHDTRITRPLAFRPTTTTGPIDEAVASRLLQQNDGGEPCIGTLSLASFSKRHAVSKARHFCNARGRVEGPICRIGAQGLRAFGPGENELMETESCGSDLGATSDPGDMVLLLVSACVETDHKRIPMKPLLAIPNTGTSRHEAVHDLVGVVRHV